MIGNNQNKDYASLLEFINSLKQTRSLGTGHRWWPKYFYHFTDIGNLPNILDSGYIYSRKYMEEKGAAFINGANPEIIEHTTNKFKNYARLYFRPKTPTLFNNEGIRPLEERGIAHCPIPIYLFFDSIGIISRDDVEFSNGSLSRKYEAELFDTIDDFRKLPFEVIYHDRAFHPDERGKIIFHRQAEIIIPEKLDLSSLKYILCRSRAELELLNNQLSPQLKKQYGSKIHNNVKADIFNRKWAFIDEIFLASDHIIITFNRPTDFQRYSGPFRIEVEVKSDINRVFKAEDFFIPESGKKKLAFAETDQYEVVISLDDIIVYKNSYDSTVKAL